MLGDALNPGVQANAPQRNYWNTAKAGVVVFTAVSGAWALLNIAMKLLLEAGYTTLKTALESDQQYNDYIPQLVEAGYVEPQLSMYANQMSNGRGQTTLHDTQIPTSLAFTKATAYIAGGLLGYIALSLVVASCYEYTEGLNPHLSAAQEQDAINLQAAALAQDQMNVVGEPVDQPIMNASEPKYIYKFWRNKAWNNVWSDDNPHGIKVNALTYKMIAHPEKAFQATKEFWTALGLTFCLELVVLFAFSQRYAEVGLPKFNDTVTQWADYWAKTGACVGSYLAEQCLGQEGNYAQQAEFRAIVEEMVNPTIRGLFFALVLAAAVPLIIYLLQVIYKSINMIPLRSICDNLSLGMQAAYNNISLAMTISTTQNGNRYSAVDGDELDLEAGMPSDFTSRTTDQATFSHGAPGGSAVDSETVSALHAEGMFASRSRSVSGEAAAVDLESGYHPPTPVRRDSE